MKPVCDFFNLNLRVLITFVLFLINFNECRTNYDIYDMNTLGSFKGNVKLGATSLFKDDALLVKATNLEYVSEQLSYLDIEAPKNQGLIISIKTLDIPKSEDCEDNYLKIEGINDVKFNKKRLCGVASDFPAAFYTNSNGKKITITFKKGHRQWTVASDGRGFELAVTAFAVRGRYNPCSQNQYFICRNGLCIQKGFTCDSYNNCGDFSDEDTPCDAESSGFDNEGPSAMMIIIILLSVFVGLALIAAVIIRKCTQNKTKRSYVDTDQPIETPPPVNLSVPTSPPAADYSVPSFLPPSAPPIYEGHGYQGYQNDEFSSQFDDPPPPYQDSFAIHNKT